MSSANVKLKHISECFIKPKYKFEESKEPYYLAPMDFAMLSLHYIQNGLMFVKPSHLYDQVYSSHQLLESLKDSMSLTLTHFYPLAGQLVTQIDEERQECLVFVDCNKGNGVRFIHATLNMTIYDILSPIDIPQLVHSLFDHNNAVNHDGHSQPLLSVQVTELLDGVFIGCSVNHAILDGASYWHFWNVWSEVHRESAKQVSSSCLPIHSPWFSDGHGASATTHPYTDPYDFVTRYEETQNRERVFHFSAESLERLKVKAHEASNTENISSLQALSALVWRSIVRANCLPYDQITNCIIAVAVKERHMLSRSLPKHYFGNFIYLLDNKVMVRELLENNLGWAASLLHQSVVNNNAKGARDYVNGWLKSPSVYQAATLFNSNNIMLLKSPRYDMYDIDFGLEKPVAVRSGYAYKFGGVVAAYTGYEGEGSIDLQICLPPNSMRALESDGEFMESVSSPFWPSPCHMLSNASYFKKLKSNM